MDVAEAAALIQDAELEENALCNEITKLQNRRTNTHLYQFNTSIVAPSPAVAKAIVAAASSVAALDTVSSDARSLTASLTNLSESAEVAVRKVRELDGLRVRIQLALDRVEDLIDLQSCLAGVNNAIDMGDLEAAALHVKRFRSLESHLPVPESDIAFMRQAESSLLAAVTKEFDKAISDNETYQQGRGQSRTQDGGAMQPAPSGAAIETKISHCCQLMNVLGHSDMGLSRYVAYLRQNFDSDCRAQMLALCTDGIDSPVAAVNALSSIFGKAAELYESICNPSTAALFGADNGPRMLLLAVHAVCDKHAARVIRSLARSGRFQAALVARERLMRGEEPKPNADADEPTEISAAEAGLAARQLENESNEAPFVLSAPGAVTSSQYRGVDYFNPAMYDMFLDELVLSLQRCASYTRLLHVRAVEVDAFRGSVGSNDTTESVMKSFHKVRDSVAELTGCYNVLEQSKLQAALTKAINLDELLDDGAIGASIDIVSASALQLLETPITMLAKANDTADSSMSSESLGGPEAAGEGAMVSTLVEDCLYICSRAIKRAFATGNADCVAGVVNGSVLVLGEKLVNELNARLKVAIEDVSSTGSPMDVTGFGVAISAAQRDRLAQLGSRIMNSSPVKLAAARLADLQVLPGAGGPTGRSPAMGSPVLARGKSGGITPQETSLPTAKLTEEVASTALALNNMQLAVACLGKLRQEMAALAKETFSEGREIEKVSNSLSGITELQQQLKKNLENGINGLCTKLTPRLRSAMNVFEGVSSLIQYELTEEQFSSISEGFNAFQTEFLPVLSSIIAPYQYSLTPPISYVVVSKIAGYLSKQLEPRIRRKRYNQLGGIQLDADIRALVAFFVDRTSRKTRSKFTRLLQIAQILNLENPEELLEYWSPTSFELTADETRSILALRGDFRAGDIGRLKL